MLKIARLILLLFLPLMTQWFSTIAAAAEVRNAPIAVIYPDIAEPYRKIFLTIIEGIEEKSKLKVQAYPIENNFNLHDLSAQLRSQNAKLVIALGRTGMRAGISLEREFKVIGAGVIGATESETGQLHISSLAPDPDLLFARLKVFMPQTKRVFVVYDAKQNAWLIKLAAQAAKQHGLELVAHKAHDTKSALLQYQEILATAGTKTDALWLIQDAVTMQDSVMLPLILQAAWSNNLTVFSSNPSHVKQGALFALYPNNLEYGKKIGSLALASLNGGGSPAPGLATLKECLLAANLSTAAHLQLRLRPEQLQAIDLIFPPP